MKKEQKHNNAVPTHSPYYGAMTFAMRAVLRIFTGMRFECDERVGQLKKSDESFIVVCQHPSMLDALVLYAMMAPRRIHAVAGRFQYVGKKSQPLFEMMGVIPKRQFYTDIACVRSMLAVLKSGGVLAFMPEGRISMDGTQGPIEESTSAFIKKCDVPVVALKVEGGHFVMGSWRKRKLHLGAVRAKASILFEKEELSQMEVSHVQEKLQEAMTYNQFESNRGKNRRYLGRARGISMMMYRCHACGAVGSFTDDGRTVRCTECGAAMRVGADRFFYPVESGQTVPFDNLAAYNAWQKQQEAEFWQQENACLAYPATCRCRDDSGAYIATQQGILRLDAKTLSFCTKEGEKLFSREMALVWGVSADYKNGQFTMYEKNGAREFELPADYCIARIINSIVILHELAKGRETEG